jgi:adenylate cyclase
MERKLAAILAADVVGFSRLVGSDETGTLANLKAHREDLIDPKIAEHGGHLVKATGDGVLVEFPSVAAAVECAVAIQRGMVDRNRHVPRSERIELRIGVNLDEIVVDGADIFGNGVNIASRLEGIAEPGTICISGTVFRQVKNRVDFRFEDLGAIKPPTKLLAAPCGGLRVFTISWSLLQSRCSARLLLRPIKRVAIPSTSQC